MNGTFVISLDFELHWGGFEKWPLQGLVKDGTFPDGTYNRYFLNTRQVIPEMLALFKRHEIHVTWAAVGMLLQKNKEELLANAPRSKPSYTVAELSAYHYIDHVGIGEDERNDPFHFAPTLVREILATPYQELGSHTFAHFYCNEEGQTSEQFREDLKAAQRVAGNYGRTLKSLVFPRNQFNDSYLKVCFEEGITSVRSNPGDWFWNIDSTQSEPFWKRINRGADAYIPIGTKNTFRVDSLRAREGFPLCIPASRLLRPYNPSEYVLNDLKISRVRQEMTRAANRGEVYHLWWHPHNFGNYPQESISGLEKILNHFDACRSTKKMQSMNMGELSATVHSV